MREEIKIVHANLRHLLRRDRNAYLVTALDNLQEAGEIGDAKTVYGLVRRVLAPGSGKKGGARAFPKMQTLDGEVCETHQQMQDTFMKHFAMQEAGEVMSQQQLASVVERAPELPLVAKDVDSLPGIGQIMGKLKKLKNGKAPGPDGLEVAVLKAGGTELA